MLHTDKTTEQVEEALSEFTRGYFKPFLFNLSEYRKHRYDYDTKYEELRAKFADKDGNIQDFNSFLAASEQFDRDNLDLLIYHTISGWFVDSGDPDDVLTVQKEYLLPSWGRNDSNNLQDEFRALLLSKGIKETEFGYIYREDVPDELVKEFLKTHKLPDIKDMMKTTYWSYTGDVVDLDGCIIVLSEYDNSIPHDDFEQIESMFNADRYHLG